MLIFHATLHQKDHYQVTIYGLNDVVLSLSDWRPRQNADARDKKKRKQNNTKCEESCNILFNFRKSARQSGVKMEKLNQKHVNAQGKLSTTEGLKATARPPSATSLYPTLAFSRSAKCFRGVFKYLSAIGESCWAALGNLASVKIALDTALQPPGLRVAPALLI